MPTFQKPTLTKGRISVPSRTIVYQFMINPNDVSIGYDPTYGAQKVPGMSHAIYQYGSGGEETIDFEIHLDGEIQFKQFTRAVAGSTDAATPWPNTEFQPNGSLSILSHIQFLESLKRPSRYGAAMEDVAPYKVILTIGPLFNGKTCIVKKASTKITYWSPAMEPMRAVVTMQFGVVVDRSQTSQDTYEGLYDIEPGNAPTPTPTVKKGDGIKKSPAVSATAAAAKAAAAEAAKVDEQAAKVAAAQATLAAFAASQKEAFDAQEAAVKSGGVTVGTPIGNGGVSGTRDLVGNHGVSYAY